MLPNVFNDFFNFPDHVHDTRYVNLYKIPIYRTNSSQKSIRYQGVKS